ncbi:MAG: META domain-containing protein, partial [Bacteroidota bacterium]|nr:META domain-containing protein [Bacteroidota bacterium]
AEVIATKTIPAEGGPTFEVSLDYDPFRLSDKGKYAVRASIKKGEELLFTSTEYIEAFKNSEDKPVEIMLRSLARKSAHLTQGNVNLANTHWKLVKLNDKPVQTGLDEKELFIHLLEEESRVSGYSGCNNFSGGYELEKDKIKFGMLMSTKKMCIDAMDQEQEFLKALSETVRYAIEGEKLYLYNREDKVVAGFQLSQ